MANEYPTKTRKPIITIEDWDKGIADDPYTGFEMIQNLNENKPGIASCGFYFTSSAFVHAPVTVTADSSTDELTSSTDWIGSNASYNGAAVTFTSTGSLPGGISAGVTYFTTRVTNNKFKISTTLANVDAGTYVDITSAGSGTITATFTQMSTITQIAYYNATNVWFAVDSNGRVWSNEWSPLFFTLVTGNTLTGAAGNGIAVWKNYLIVFRNQAIDAWGPLTSAVGSRTWTSNFAGTQTSQTSVGSHNALVAQDDLLYWCDGRYIGSLLQKADQTFDPASGATFTGNGIALSLPSYVTAIELEEYGQYICIGANANKRVYVFPWDRVSPLSNFPVEIPETTVQSLVNINNVLYVVTNSRAAVYSTNLSSVALVRALPNSLMVAAYPSNGSLSINSATKIGGKLYLGVTAGTSTTGNTGVYSLDVSTGALKLANTLSNGVNNYNSSITAIGQTGQFSDGTPSYFAFNKNDSTITVDIHHNQYPYTAYESQIITPFYEMSYDAFKPYALQKAVFYLQWALGGSDAIKLEYRKVDGGTWTSCGELTASTANAVISPTLDMPLYIYANQVQFRISLKSANFTGSTFVRLKKVEII